MFPLKEVREVTALSPWKQRAAQLLIGGENPVRKLLSLINQMLHALGRSKIQYQVLKVLLNYMANSTSVLKSNNQKQV